MYKLVALLDHLLGVGFDVCEKPSRKMILMALGSGFPSGTKCVELEMHKSHSYGSRHWYEDYRPVSPLGIQWI